jgi:hypothetical protein
MDTTYKQNKAILLNKWHDFGQLGSIWPQKLEIMWLG